MVSHSSRGRTRSRIVGTLLALGVAAALAPAAAQAQDTGVTGTLSAGQLTLVPPANADFGSNALTGVQTTLNANLGDWSVDDATGGLIGWNVTAEASPVQVGGVTISGMTPTLQADAPTLLTGTGASPDADISAGPYDLSAGATLVTAAAGAGVGPVTITQGGATDLRLTLPYNAVEGTYTSTVTFTVTPGA